MIPYHVKEDTTPAAVGDITFTLQFSRPVASLTGIGFDKSGGAFQATLVLNGQLGRIGAYEICDPLKIQRAGETNHCAISFYD